MKILFFGDVYGKFGRSGLREALPQILKKFSPDFVLANAENLAHGRGPTEKQLQELAEAGIDGFTSGNHIFDAAGYEELFTKNAYPLARPANYPDGVPGKGFFVLKKKNKALFVGNLLGRIFMGDPVDNPFFAAEKLIAEAQKLKIKNIFLDFHAEATSEKTMLGLFLDGKVSALVGTHTHVQTADERILPDGTAYISDAGFCGVLNSAIGAKPEAALKRFLTQLPAKLEMAEGRPIVISGVFVETDTNGKAKKIERVYQLVE
ncbi:MAG: TIGR00282 family metallophosphoesterase [Candidatus Peribacteraceae bacterium]|nr:TIGR00282 family metallophosphoesterase [Candidatus Peribacteraceae bacterium]